MGENITDSKIIYNDGRGTTITAQLVADEEVHVNDYSGAYTDENIAAFHAGQWQYVGVEAVVAHHGVEIGRASVWAVEHGELALNLAADAFEWTPAEEGAVTVMGSPLWSVTAEAVGMASEWVRTLAGRDGRWLSRDRTALGGLEQFVAPRNDALMAETHALALMENAERVRS